MANLRMANFMGDVYYNAFTDTVYHILANEPSAGAADTSPGAGDEVDIEGVTFDDDNTTPYKSEWSGCQVGVAKYTDAYNAEHTVVDGDVGTFVSLFTAPSDGEARVWHNFYGRGDIYVNGIYVSSMDYTDHNSLKKARGIRLQSGDVVSIGGSDDGDPLDSGDVDDNYYANFCPDTYP